MRAPELGNGLPARARIAGDKNFVDSTMRSNAVFVVATSLLLLGHAVDAANMRMERMNDKPEKPEKPEKVRTLKALQRASNAIAAFEALHRRSSIPVSPLPHKTSGQRLAPCFYCLRHTLTMCF